MANDISYFKVQGDNTQYSFNDADLETRIGAEEMGTTARTVTGAIAELADKVGENTTDIADNASAIGTLSNLTTSAKGSLVVAINEVNAYADTNASAISSLNSKFAYRDYTVTTGTSQYSSMYYADTTVATDLGDAVGCVIISTTSNRPAFAVRITSYSVRVFSNVANTTVTVRVLFMK